MTQEIFVGFYFRNVRKITKGVIIDRIISHQPAKPGWCFLIAWFPRNYFYSCQNENSHSQSGMLIAFINIDNKLIRRRLYAFAHHLLPKRPCARIRVCRSHIKCGYFKCRAVCSAVSLAPPDTVSVAYSEGELCPGSCVCSAVSFDLTKVFFIWVDTSAARSNTLMSLTFSRVFILLNDVTSFLNLWI